MKNFWISRFAATDGALEFARGNKLVFDVGYEGHYPRKKKGIFACFLLNDSINVLWFYFLSFCAWTFWEAF